MAGVWNCCRGFGNNFAVVYNRWCTIETDLNDLRSANKISDILGRGSKLRLNLTNSKSPVRYLVDSQTVSFLTKIRNALLKRNKKWPNNDTRLGHNEFSKENTDR